LVAVKATTGEATTYTVIDGAMTDAEIYGAMAVTMMGVAVGGGCVLAEDGWEGSQDLHASFLKEVHILRCCNLYLLTCHRACTYFFYQSPLSLFYFFYFTVQCNATRLSHAQQGSDTMGINHSATNTRTQDATQK
jgi:hypothetical protein